MIKQATSLDVVAQHVTELQTLHDRLQVARSSGNRDDVSAIQDQMRSAVDAARRAGVGWAAIGSALDVARGNAYQRFRKRTQLT